MVYNFTHKIIGGDMNTGKIMVMIFLIISFFNFAQAQDKKTSDFLSDYTGQIYFVQSRIMDLEKAMPQETFSWRPMEGVRSVSEVYLHTAMGNYLFLQFSGLPVPEDIKVEDDMGSKFEKSTMDKEEISKFLDRSFKDMLAAVAKMKKADLEKRVSAFGMEMSQRNFMMSMLNHLHEHLGQAIAYARINKVVPPWTAKEQAEAKAKK
jgi:uncharacterized damage-inducible protein DinB